MNIENNNKKKENETVKEKILKILLKGSKTTPDILKDLGYSSNQYSIISKPLKMLARKGYIQYEKKDSDKADLECKLWYTVKDLGIYIKMLQEYPRLLTTMHKSERVLDSFVIRITVPTLNTDTGELYEKVKVLEGDEKHAITDKLRLSPEFFKYAINIIENKSEDHTEELAIFMESLDGKSRKKEIEEFESLYKKYNQTPKPGSKPRYIETVFKICVFMDILKGQSSDEAKEYVSNHPKYKIDL